jgi:GNAT superfamily N-acetyltransferase
MSERQTFGQVAIRQALGQEAAAVSAVVDAAYEKYVPIIGGKPGPMLDDYAARIAAGQVWVLAAGDVLGGVLVLEDGPEQFMLDNIAIDPNHQGAGYGRKLLDFAEQQARQRGWSQIDLYTNVLMADNIAIYLKRGYVERGRRREKGFDRVYMAKSLL